MSTPSSPAQAYQPRRLLDQIRDVALAHFGRFESGQPFVEWTQRFIFFHEKRNPDPHAVMVRLAYVLGWCRVDCVATNNPSCWMETTQMLGIRCVGEVP